MSRLFGKVDFIFQKIVQGPKKSENKRKWKRSIFVIDSYLKDIAFKAVKREAMQSSKQGVRKGYHLSIEAIRNEYLFREKG